MISPSSQASPEVRRRSGFRLVALALGVLLVGAVELTLRLLGFSSPDRATDPFVGFSSIQPLFVPDETGNRFEISPSRQVYFRPDSFPTNKSDSTFRIFCLGGSTVQGRPFEPPTAFTTWLRLGLQAAEKDRNWEVINCGGISYASYRLVPILDEVLGHDPDLIILYTGHNEFLEERTYGDIKHKHPMLRWILERASRLHSLVLLRRAWHSVVESSAGDGSEPTADKQDVLSQEVDALLDQHDGFLAYRRDEGFERGVVAHFAHNLRRMIDLTREAGVSLVLVNPVSNLRDSPPFKSQHREGLNPDEDKRFNQLVKQAREEARWNKHRAVDLLQKAIAIDDQFAATHWELGRFCDDLGLPRKARDAYIRAKELDVCPLRARESIHEILVESAVRENIPLVDARRVIEELSRDGIPGTDWLIDHVHPTIRGHQRIADAILSGLIRLGHVRPGPGWEGVRDHQFDEHEKSLPRAYHARAIKRLERLQVWARQRAAPQDR